MVKVVKGTEEMTTFFVIVKTCFCKKLGSPITTFGDDKREELRFAFVNFLSADAAVGHFINKPAVSVKNIRQP